MSGFGFRQSHVKSIYSLHGYIYSYSYAIPYLYLLLLLFSVAENKKTSPAFGFTGGTLTHNSGTDGGFSKIS